MNKRTVPADSDDLTTQFMHFTLLASIINESIKYSNKNLHSILRFSNQQINNQSLQNFVHIAPEFSFYFLVIR